MTGILTTMLSPPHLRSSSVATALSILSGILAPQHVTAATVSSEVAQTFLGIGGSGAWWPTDLYHYPDEVKKNLSALLFSEDGMGISSYRYNVGGGGTVLSLHLLLYTRSFPSEKCGAREDLLIPSY